MNLAILSSVALILGVIYIPFFNPIFNTVPLGWNQWEVLLPLLLIPRSLQSWLNGFISGYKTKRDLIFVERKTFSVNS